MGICPVDGAAGARGYPRRGRAQGDHNGAGCFRDFGGKRDRRSLLVCFGQSGRKLFTPSPDYPLYSAVLCKLGID